MNGVSGNVNIHVCYNDYRRVELLRACSVGIGPGVFLLVDSSQINKSKMRDTATCIFCVLGRNFCDESMSDIYAQAEYIMGSKSI